MFNTITPDNNSRTEHYLRPTNQQSFNSYTILT